MSKLFPASPQAQHRVFAFDRENGGVKAGLPTVVFFLVTLLTTLTILIGDHGCSCGASCQCPAGNCNCPVRDM
jgi:hypothetical protein